MAGSFGYESEHHQVSLQMAEMQLLPAIRQAPDAGTTQTIGKPVTITINKAP